MLGGKDMIMAYVWPLFISTMKSNQTRIKNEIKNKTVEMTLIPTATVTLTKVKMTTQKKMSLVTTKKTVTHHTDLMIRVEMTPTD